MEIYNFRYRWGEIIKRVWDIGENRNFMLKVFDLNIFIEENATDNALRERIPMLYNPMQALLTWILNDDILTNDVVNNADDSYLPCKKILMEFITLKMKMYVVYECVKLLETYNASIDVHFMNNAMLFNEMSAFKILSRREPHSNALTVIICCSEDYVKFTLYLKRVSGNRHDYKNIALAYLHLKSH